MASKKNDEISDLVYSIIKFFHDRKHPDQKLGEKQAKPKKAKVIKEAQEPKTPKVPRQPKEPKPVTQKEPKPPKKAKIAKDLTDEEKLALEIKKANKELKQKNKPTTPEEKQKQKEIDKQLNAELKARKEKIELEKEIARQAEKANKELKLKQKPKTLADKIAQQADKANKEIEKKLSLSDTIAKLPAVQVQRKQKESLDWFYKKLKVSPQEWDENSFSLQKGKPFIGSMMHYVYDPKWKEELPHWDKFPLVIPIETYKDGFLGLNLHYLPPLLRGKLFDVLMENTKKYKGATVMAVNYSILKQIAKNTYFERCIKRYLTTHIVSRIVVINEAEWEKVVFLPTQQFQKQSARVVWGQKK